MCDFSEVGVVVVYVCVYGEGGGVRGLRENERVMGGSTKSWKESDRYISS